MKRGLIVALLMCMITFFSTAQIYDGMTQATKWRVFVPTTVSMTGAKKTVIAPFIGFRQNIGNHWSITPVFQYNINYEAFIPQIWINFNIRERLYILLRSMYNFKSQHFSEILSVTYKLLLDFMIDATWENVLNGKKFCKDDRLQFIGGWAWKMLVGNIGYSCLLNKGLIANIRWKVTKYNWLQLKYDDGIKSLQVSCVLQFN